MPACPVCGETQNADESAFTHHVNSHFDAGPSSPRPTSPISMSGYDRMNEAAYDTSSAEEYCPICEFPLSFLSPNEAETHVNSCLDGGPPVPFQNPAPNQNSGNHRKDHLVEDEEEDYVMDFDFSVNNATTLQGRNRNNDDGVDEGWEGPARPGGWMDWAGRKVERGDQWWDPINGSTTDIPGNFSPGVIPILAQTLQTASHQGITRRAVLCRDVTHIKGIWKFDMGWGCGYRNALMSTSSLLSIPAYQAIFDRQNNGAEPGVRRVQGWIQEAWEEGHDPEGRKQLKGKILGTRKWIGPSDLYAMFTYKGIPCELYDFPKPKDVKDGCKTAHIALQKWVKAYFSDGSETHAANGGKTAFDVLMRTDDQGAGRGEVVRISSKFPLILQHSGHSRTIIGYEENSRGDINLLLFDPGRSMPKDIRSQAIIKFTHHRQTAQHSPSLPQIDTGTSSSSSSSKPGLLKKRSSSISDTHESRPFSPPFTNGRAEIDYSTLTSTNGLNFSHADGASHTRGGTLPSIPIEEDEEVTPSGWVRKKISKVKSTTSNKNDDKGDDDKSLDMLKTLNYFRINLGTLSKHTEYQVLAFTSTGEGRVLSKEERENRKIVSSTIVRV